MNVDAVADRVRAEFEEMPGLTLTVPQASRLFGLDQDVCRRIDAVDRAGRRRRTCAQRRDGRRGSAPRRRCLGPRRPPVVSTRVAAGRRASPGRRTLRPTPSSFRSASGAGGSTASGRSRSRPSRSPARLRQSARRRRADQADAEDPLGLRIEHQLGQAVGPIERDRAARGAPRELGDRHLAAVLLRLRLGQAAPGQLGIGEDHRRNRPRLERRRSRRQSLRRRPALRATPCAPASARRRRRRSRRSTARRCAAARRRR